MNKITTFFSRYWKILIPIMAVILIVIILSSAVMLITLDDGTYKEGDMGNVPYAASTYVKSIKFTEDGIKFIYTQTDETTGEEISEEKTSSEMAQITWDEMKKNGSTVENYLDSVDELEKLMNAEIITQYPKLDNVTGLNGTIEFERRKSDGTTVKLQFINLETFNSYIEEKRTDVINYYTLDDSGNVLIGVVDETTETLNSNDEEMELNEYSDSLSDANKKSEGNYLKTEYNVYSKSINYKSAVDKYTMPFQYLWSIIVIGDDKGVGLELADLVENSQIVISIFDNITTTVNESTYTYHKEKKVDVSATATANTNYGTYTKSDSWKKADEWKTDIDYEIKHVITYKNNTPIVDLTKADVWVVDYSKEYDYESSTQTSQENNERNLDDTEYVEDSDSPKSSSSGDGSDLDRYDKFKGKLSDLTTELEKDVKKNVTLVTENVIVGYEGYISKPIIEKRIKELTMSTGITSCKGKYYTHQVDKKEVDVSTTYSQKYVAKTPINNPKVEKKTEEEIKNGTGQNNFVTILSDSNHTNARRKITEEVTSWFFELLEENPDTVNMVDLTSYLLYKVTGDENRFNNSYDFSIYEPGDMNYISFSNGASYQTLNLTDEDLQILYKITSAERGGGTQQQQEYVVSVILNRVLSSKFPNTVHDVVFQKNQFQPTRNGAYEAAVPSQTTIDAVNNVVQNGDTAKYAVYFMTPAASLKEKWITNCKFLFNDVDDNLRYENVSGCHNFYTTQAIIDELQQYAISGGGTIVEEAIKVHKYVRENGYEYAQRGVTVPNNNGRTIDCSSFVTWVLVNAGVNGFNEGMYQWTSSTFESNPQGWQEISVNDAQPGDILVYSNHVEIVAAVGSDRFIVYNCGGATSIKAVGSNGLPESSNSGRSKSQIRKILRVP